jgi:ankyrin repeat protein
MMADRRILIILLAFLATAVACAAHTSNRKAHQMTRADGINVRCLEPPPDVIAHSQSLNIDLAVKNLGEVVRGSAGTQLDSQRIRNISAQVADFEVIEFRFCMQYANGILTPEEYRRFLQLLPLLRESSGTVPPARRELSELGIPYAPSEFLTRVKQEDTDAVRLFLDAGMSPNVADGSGQTVLMWAAAHGNTSFVEALIARGANVNARTSYGRSSALTVSAQKGHARVVRVLLERGAEVNRNGEALVEAARRGHREVVRELLNHGMDINSKTYSGTTALIAAAHEGHGDLVELLLAKGAGVNAKGSFGRTALIEAAIRGDTGIVHALLARGAQVNDKGDDGRTALIWAADGGHAEIGQALLSSGADVTVKDKGGRTALMRAKENRSNSVVELLMKAGANE